MSDDRRRHRDAFNAFNAFVRSRAHDVLLAGIVLSGVVGLAIVTLARQIAGT